MWSVVFECFLSYFVLNSKYKIDSQSKMYASHIPAFYLQANDKLYSNTFLSVSPLRQPLIFLNPYETIECFICFQNVKHVNNIKLRFFLIFKRTTNKKSSTFASHAMQNCRSKQVPILSNLHSPA